MAKKTKAANSAEKKGSGIDKDTTKTATKNKKAKNPNPYKEAKKKRLQAEKKSASDKKKNSKGNESSKISKNKFVDFFKGVRAELKKINWSRPIDTLKNTGIVLLLILIIGAFVWILDFILSKGLGAFYNMANKQAFIDPLFSVMTFLSN
ncbi:MAG: preprotein translocase subunit SecE [Clostridia bacterium]|nr:preprotein translocase subunit SecE [Clostridia bacterium]